MSNLNIKVAQRDHYINRIRSIDQHVENFLNKNKVEVKKTPKINLTIGNLDVNTMNSEELDKLTEDIQEDTGDIVDQLK